MELWWEIGFVTHGLAFAEFPHKPILSSLTCVLSHCKGTLHMLQYTVLPGSLNMIAFPIPSLLFFLSTLLDTSPVKILQKA